MSDASPAQTAAPDVQPYDFRRAAPLSLRQMRGLRAHEEHFLSAMSARVALFLHSEFPARLANIEVVSYQKWAQGWQAPCHLSLFKTEPLRGISILGIPSGLALAMVDRLLGGQGNLSDTARELSEIERALLEQVVQIALEEWCANWASIKELKASLLGSESSGNFLQSSPQESNVLLLSIETRVGECAGCVQMAFPYAALEPLIRQLCPDSENISEKPAPAAAGPVKWSNSFGDVAVPVTAEWNGLELSAREILHLAPGDVLQLTPQMAGQVSLRIGEQPKFSGRLGAAGGKWAVQLSNAINRDQTTNRDQKLTYGAESKYAA